MKIIKIGRGAGNNVVVDSPVVSASHAVITVSDAGIITIEDLNSKNGTYVNGQRISKATLSPTSTVLLGNHPIDWKKMLQASNPQPPQQPVSIPGDVVDKKLIGRNPQAQIQFSFDDVSGAHAYLCKRANGDILLIDNHSTNGTYVNGNKITAPHVLRKGDLVSISKHPLNWEAIYQQKQAVKYKTFIPVAAAVAAILVIVSLRPWTWFGKDWSQVYAEHKHDVVMVHVRSCYLITLNGHRLSNYLGGNEELDFCAVDSDGEIRMGKTQTYSGTGFFISEDGKLLTNRHVVTEDQVAEKEEYIRKRMQAALVENGMSDLASLVKVDFSLSFLGIAPNDTHSTNESDLIPCRILKTSDLEELDVAILQTYTKKLPEGSTYLDLSKSAPSKDLKLGYGICTIGFPAGLAIGSTAVGIEANNQSGEVAQNRGKYQYGHNINILGGASGSPVYDKRGRFAGIIVSAFTGKQGFNQAIHPDPVIKFVEENQ